MSKKRITPGDSVIVNRDHDHWMDADAIPFIGKMVVVIKVTKAGLYLCRLPDGKVRSFPLYNLDPVEDAPPL